MLATIIIPFFTPLWLEKSAFRDFIVIRHSSRLRRSHRPALRQSETVCYNGSVFAMYLYAERALYCHNSSVGMGLAPIRLGQRDQAMQRRVRGPGWGQAPSLLKRHCTTSL